MTTPPDLFVAESLPEAEDNWWTLVRIDARTGLLAGPLTPDEFVEEQSFLQLPEGLSAWERNQALEWAEVLATSADEPPTDVTTASDLPIAISAPARGEQISGLVDISGRASSDDFAGYRLEYRFETIPGDWIVFAEGSAPIEDGVLATWDTTDLPLGLYTVRLVMDDERLGESSTRVQVLVISAIPPTPTESPPATPEAPGPEEDP